MNLQARIFFANGVSPMILGSQFRLVTFDLGFAFALGGLTGFGGFSGGTQALWTGRGRIAAKANIESVFGNQVTNLFPWIHLLRSLQNLGGGTKPTVAGSH